MCMMYLDCHSSDFSVTDRFDVELDSVMSRMICFDLDLLVCLNPFSGFITSPA